MSTPPVYPERVGTPVSSVSDFVLQIRRLVEGGIPLGWVAGEISNLVRASSGHVYFSLKDERAQIRCAMWRNRAQLLPFQLQEGMHVEVRAQATIYEARGDLQLSVENIRRAGQGNLYEAFLRLKARLEAEGLFAAERKRALPKFPHGIGIVTSTAAAALRDVLATLARRAPGIPLVIYPTPVQGDAAGEQVAAAIQSAGGRAALDGVEVLIVCRGGGSIEDLWAFNHEAVARAVVASPVPVISGVGHETDVTLIDFVADVRGTTPTAAAELVSAGWNDLRGRLPELSSGLQRAMQWRLRQAAQRLDGLQHRLDQSHPRVRVAQGMERIAALAERHRRAWRVRQQRQASRLVALESLLAAHAPRIGPLHDRLEASRQRLDKTMAWRLQALQQGLQGLAARLEGLNPDAVLARGYAIVRDDAGQILRDAQTLNAEDTLDIQLAGARLRARLLGSP